MRIEVTLDKVQLNQAELQTVIKEAIEKQTNRRVSGDVNFNQSERTNGIHAWCFLKPQPIVREGY
jgi:hypothetical protein